MIAAHLEIIVILMHVRGIEEHTLCSAATTEEVFLMIFGPEVGQQIRHIGYSFALSRILYIGSRGKLSCVAQVLVSAIGIEIKARAGRRFWLLIRRPSCERCRNYDNAPS